MTILSEGWHHIAACGQNTVVEKRRVLEEITATTITIFYIDFEFVGTIIEEY